MQVLLIFYGVIALLAIIAQIFLYRKNPSEKIYLLNLVIGALLAVIAYTSFPSNYLFQKFLAFLFGLIGVSALFVRSKVKQALIAKVMLTISIVGAFVLLLF